MYEKYFKRLLDIILSGVALIVLAPVLIMVAILVRIKLGSPVLFKQKRPGKNEEIFNMYKFRTMTDEKDVTGNLLPDENRLPQFGKTLRSTSLDELPELWNIFKGDMSFIGPRPLLIKYLPYYTINEKKRHSVRPGLTGYAQINGRNNLSWDDRLLLDIEYVNRLSFILDLKIFFQTIYKVISRDDIATGEELIMRDLNEERSGRDFTGQSYRLTK